MGINIGKLLTRVLPGILPVMLLMSCIADHEIIPDIPAAEGEALVRFSLQLPGSVRPAPGSSVRALGVGDENEVREVDVLVFVKNGGEYVYKARGSGITTANGDSRLKTFTVKLRQGEFDLVVLANASAIVDNVVFTGLDKADALTLLTAKTPADGKWIATSTTPHYKPFPMWGNVGNVVINADTDLTGDNRVKLARMMARVDVGITETSFLLNSVDLYNYNTHGSLVPETADWDGINNKVIHPGVPGASLLKEGPVTYANGEINPIDNECSAEIYLFEAENHTDGSHATAKGLTDRTCLVIGGFWDANDNGDFTDDGAPTYYRVDFSEGSGTSRKFLDVLRNHHYRFNVTRVSGYGYEDSYTAFISEPVNIEAGILVWDDVDFEDIVVDGQYHLAVSRGEFAFSRNAVTTDQEYNVLYLLTNYMLPPGEESEERRSGWYVEKIVDKADETQSVTWLSLMPDHGAANDKTKVVLTVEDNPSGQERSAVVYIAAGRIRYAINVIQSATPPLSIRLTDKDGMPVTELVFATTEGTLPPWQELTVDWTPETADLWVVNFQAGTYSFPSNVGEPQNGTIVGGNGSTGTITYTIQPGGFHTADLNGDPFVEKVSRVDFTTNNGVSYVSAGVFLRQYNYNLLTDVKPTYLLESQQETIRVRANFPWEIISVEDEGGILKDENELVGRIGGNNKVTGDPLSFTMEAEALDGSRSGEMAVITFRNLADAGSLWTVRIKSEEAVYVGYFGGKLVDKGAGEWQFERKLFVQRKNEATAKWHNYFGYITTGVTDDVDGKSNTLELKTMGTDYEAATACFRKNDNHVAIGSVDDPDYLWYLPAQKQLMAIWTVNNGLADHHRLYGGVWTSTESRNPHAWTVDFNPIHGGNVESYTNKTSGGLVRCVREEPD